LEKYLYRKGSETEAYFRGRRDGLTMLEANIEQAHKAGIEKVVEFVEELIIGWDCAAAIDIRKEDWQAKLKEWGISK